MKILEKAAPAAALVSALFAWAAPAQAQTLNMAKALDSPHYDSQRTTWSPTSDVTHMIQDTLVALDWDGKTAIPLLAKSWTMSPDGKLYTFKLRDDVQFCSGKKFTAADVLYSFNRQRDPATRAPYAWRAGKIKELRAPDPYTVEYELTEPYSDLLVQLTMFNNSIHNKDSVEALGKDYGVKGIDGTGPWCWVSWQPRTELLLRRHDAYRWGPAMYKNPGPVKFERLSIKIVPEDSSRLAAMMSGRFDVTNHFPTQFIDQAKKSPMLNVEEAKPNFQLMYFGFKTTRPLVSDKRVREAMNIAINRAELVKSVMLGQAEPAYTYIDPNALDFAPSTKGIIKEDVARANRLLDEAGWTQRGPDGIRMKNGERLAPVVFIPQVTYFPRMTEAIQGYMRKVGIDWKITALESSIMPGRLTGQDFDLWTVTVPYLSAGELMNFYFDSAQIPVPNRMNWKDAATDAAIQKGRVALTTADRSAGNQLAQEIVMKEHLWIPVMNVRMYQTTTKKIRNARTHMLFQYTFYKGLDHSL
ncbi:MAG: ABC transporter substrate-binding protein [Burkholderiaceae bacterium]|nr:ABC transporter substrate-binding protein [Burkholderiaceae bacterium]